MTGFSWTRLALTGALCTWLVSAKGFAVNRAEEAYGKLPLYFEPNRGQSPPEVKFQARTPQYAMFFTSEGVTLQSRDDGTVKMSFAGANVEAPVAGLDPRQGRSNYLIGNDNSSWIRDIPSFGRIEYRDLYPGITLLFYGNQQDLEYDFVLRPGTDPGTIHLAFDGVDRMYLEGDGDLVLCTPVGLLRHRRPRVYQELASGLSEVPGRYVLTGGRQVGFSTDSYDRTRPLIIDPSVIYATYLGGSKDDRGYGIAVDSSGCAYVVGETWSTDFSHAPLSNAALASSSNVFVAKLNPAGTALVYLSYIGGATRDSGRAIAVDGTGNAYITGFTYSTDFPVTAGSFQTAGKGQEEAFVAKLNPAGNSLVYSSFLGGSGSDFATGLALDSSGNAYVTGYTSSLDFPVTAGAFRTSFGGGFYDAFITKLNPSGTALAYSTYLGGSASDMGQGIAVDSSGAAFVTGQTSSTDFPASSAVQAAQGGGGDAFLVKLAPTGSALVFSTYLGGRSTDYANAVALDSSGNPYVTGATLSSNFPTTSGSAQPGKAASYDAFVAKYTSDGRTLVYSTCLGGSGSDEGTSIAVDSQGRAFVAGFTDSPDFPGQSPVQAQFRPVRDSFLAVLKSDGSAFDYASYLGGAGEDRAQGIALDGSGYAYLTGYTLSSSFPITTGTYQTGFGGAVDAFVAKIDARANAPSPPSVVSLTPYTGGGSIQTFSAVFSDPNGYANMTWGYLLVNYDLVGWDGCWIQFSATNLWLYIDPVTGWQGPVAIGSAATLQNSQCSVPAAGASVTGSGKTLTLNVAITFKPTYVGLKRVYLEIFNANGLTSGWQQEGNWTPPGTNSAPQVVSVTPSSGAGPAQTFHFVATDSNGYADITWGQVVFNYDVTGWGACWVYFSTATNRIWLSNDAGRDWQTPANFGTSTTLQNSQCTVQAANSSFSDSGNTLTVTLAITFKSGFVGAKNIYMNAWDSGGIDSGWQQVGTWTAPGTDVAPQAVSVTPPSGSASNQVFTFAASHPDGYDNIVVEQMVFNYNLNGWGACWVYFSPSSNRIWLNNDIGTNWGGAAFLGDSVTLQNSHCTVKAANSSASGSGNVLTLNLAMTFTAAFVGAKQVYLRALDAGGLDSGWQQVGTWTAPGTDTAPQAVSVSPASGSGSAQTFSVVNSYVNGYTGITWTQTLFGSNTTGVNACWVYFDPATNRVWLSNDAGTDWGTPAYLGNSGSLQNTQCTILTAGSSFTGSGNNLTLTISVVFKSAFTGARNTYAQVWDGNWLGSGWRTLGTWTVP